VIKVTDKAVQNVYNEGTRSKKREGKEMSFNEFKQKAANLYKLSGRYYRLFGIGITPNGCWVIAPKMVELLDIDIATGKDIYGSEIKIHDIIGTVNASNQYIKY